MRKIKQENNVKAGTVKEIERKGSACKEDFNYG
ncbi:hypothetical protein SAMN05216245_11734 [Succiniclasticum ruminis DSM 9236]|uniref:Uncharacterized protein n=1 Tax=Succiniclasticum ruminis DSM 9236 TaxID=1123323 RepID=A0A1I2D6Y9_9FIRM|nr:hypothetical protein SAMN05216245_11734 [Succiniclasticum ruminis DSM 9236]